MSVRVLVIHKKSAYQVYVRERGNRRIRELLASGDPNVSRLVRADAHHRESLARAKAVLKKLGVSAQFRYRADAGPVDGFDLVVTLGGDGTFLWTSHGVSAQTPMVAVNTAPRDSVGYFTAGTKDQLEDVLADAVHGKLRAMRIARMQVALDGVTLHKRVLNDALFCHPSPAATSRYTIRLGAIHEEHKSSGIWVAPAAGSSAAIGSAGGRALPIRSRKLQFVVRELYLPMGGRSRLAHGVIAPGRTLQVRSQMRAGRVYLDGPHLGHDVHVGGELEFCVSDEPLLVLGFRHA